MEFVDASCPSPENSATSPTFTSRFANFWLYNFRGLDAKWRHIASVSWPCISPATPGNLKSVPFRLRKIRLATGPGSCFPLPDSSSKRILILVLFLPQQTVFLPQEIELLLLEVQLLLHQLLLLLHVGHVLEQRLRQLHKCLERLHRRISTREQAHLVFCEVDFVILETKHGRWRTRTQRLG